MTRLVIYVSYKPAILLDVDGQPIRGTMKNGKLEFVINTRWPLFFDPPSSMFYLLAGEQWLKAAALEGPWAATKKLPERYEHAGQETGVVKLEEIRPSAVSQNPKRCRSCGLLQHESGRDYSLQRQSCICANSGNQAQVCHEHEKLYFFLHANKPVIIT